MDKSNGYEQVAATFIAVRGAAADGIGTAAGRHWVRALPPGATVLDLGCGTGLPISKVLMDAGMAVYGVDASPTLVQTFRQNFPHTPVACEAVEDSPFFNRKFDGIIAWGLLFLLPGEAQAKVLQKAAEALHPGGRLLFTAPAQAVAWQDALTGQRSASLGAQAYKALLTASGMSLVGEFDDEGGNHYYSAVKI